MAHCYIIAEMFANVMLNKIQLTLWQDNSENIRSESSLFIAQIEEMRAPVGWS